MTLGHPAIGYERKEMVSEIKEQMETLEYFHTFRGCFNIPAIKLVKKVSELVPVDNAKVFYY